MAKKRCLVTGGTGFIGYNLTLELLKQGYDVLITGREGENYAGVKHLLAGYDLFSLDWERIGNIEILFHQAAIVDTTFLDQKEMIRVNCEGSKDLFEKAVRAGCRHIVYASSTATYGNEPAPYREGVTKQNPLNPYGVSKKMLDDYALQFSANHPDITVVGLRYCNVYGPHDAHKGKMRCYLTQMAEQMRKGNPRLFRDGEQKRDYIYIKDLIRANILSSQSKESCIVNCGSGKAVSFNRLVELLNKTLGLNRIPEYIDNPYEKSYQSYTECDMTLAAQKIGFVPAYSVEEGIKDLYGKAPAV